MPISIFFNRFILYVLLTVGFSYQLRAQGLFYNVALGDKQGLDKTYDIPEILGKISEGYLGFVSDRKQGNLIVKFDQNFQVVRSRKIQFNTSGAVTFLGIKCFKSRFYAFNLVKNKKSKSWEVVATEFDPVDFSFKTKKNLLVSAVGVKSIGRKDFRIALSEDESKLAVCLQKVSSDKSKFEYAVSVFETTSLDKVVWMKSDELTDLPGGEVTLTDLAVNQKGDLFLLMEHKQILQNRVEHRVPSLISVVDQGESQKHYKFKQDFEHIVGVKMIPQDKSSNLIVAGVIKDSRKEKLFVSRLNDSTGEIEITGISRELPELFESRLEEDTTDVDGINLKLFYSELRGEIYLVYERYNGKPIKLFANPSAEGMSGMGNFHEGNDFFGSINMMCFSNTGDVKWEASIPKSQSDYIPKHTMSFVCTRVKDKLMFVFNDFKFHHMAECVANYDFNKCGEVPYTAFSKLMDYTDRFGPEKALDKAVEEYESVLGLYEVDLISGEVDNGVELFNEDKAFKFDGIICLPRKSKETMQGECVMILATRRTLGKEFCVARIRHLSAGIE